MEVVDEIHENAVFYDTVLDLIPPEYYFHGEEENEYRSRFMKNSKEEAPRQHFKEESKKNKKAKFSLSAEKHITDIQREKIIKAKEESKQFKEEAEKNPSASLPTFDAKPAATLDELRQRLKDKVASLAASRQKKTEGGHKRPLKQERLEWKAKRIATEQTQSKDQQTTEEKVVEKPAEKTVEKSVEKTVEKPAEKPAENKMITPDINEVLSNVQFGKISEKEKDPLKFEKKKSKKQQLTKLLEKTQAKKKRLEELKNTEEGEKLADDMNWDSVMKKADGLKVKDDEALIKQSLRNITNKKKKSEQEWKQRVHKQKMDKKHEEKTKRAGFEGRKNEFLNKNKKGDKKEDAPKAASNKK
ncbi:hypothetical protein WA158_001495 [Blastocystis sp. Blastoise]